MNAELRVIEKRVTVAAFFGKPIFPQRAHRGITFFFNRKT